MNRCMATNTANCARCHSCLLDGIYLVFEAFKFQSVLTVINGNAPMKQGNSSTADVVPLLMTHVTDAAT